MTKSYDLLKKAKDSMDELIDHASFHGSAIELYPPLDGDDYADKYFALHEEIKKHLEDNVE